MFDPGMGCKGCGDELTELANEPFVDLYDRKESALQAKGLV